MDIQSLNRIVSTPDTSPRQLTYRITDCSPITSVFQKHLLLTHKLGIASAIEMAAESDE